MKSEDMAQKCPKCGSTDKSISRTCNIEELDKFTDSVYIQHIPTGSIGVIRCSECGYVFEYCKNSKMPVKIKKIILD